jgi:hypothetical protein
VDVGNSYSARTGKNAIPDGGLQWLSAANSLALAPLRATQPSPLYQPSPIRKLYKHRGQMRRLRAIRDDKKRSSKHVKADRTDNTAARHSSQTQQ